MPTVKSNLGSRAGAVNSPPGCRCPFAGHSFNLPAVTHPPIRSYVLRQGRFSTGQQRAYEELLPRYGLAFEPRKLDWAAVFGRTAPVVVEIGSGMGETTVAIAQARPDTDFLAIEVHTPGVGSLLRQISERALTNVRVIQHDAIEVLAGMVPPGSLEGVHLFFPDPWPKKRHHKRRIVQPETAALVASCLRRGGYFHFATDWPEYADHVLHVLSATPGLANGAAGFIPRPAARPETKFERRGLALGHEVRDLVFHKEHRP